MKLAMRLASKPQDPANDRDPREGESAERHRMFVQQLVPTIEGYAEVLRCPGRHEMEIHVRQVRLHLAHVGALVVLAQPGPTRIPRGRKVVDCLQAPAAAGDEMSGHGRDRR